MATILYVEDDESLAFVTRDNLELKGYHLTYCTDGISALERTRKQKFDLCILDVMLPEMDGFSLAAELRKTDREIPIIFLSAKSLEEDRIKGLQVGGDDYLVKPFSMEELILKIEIFLKRRNILQASNDTACRIGTFEFDYANLTLRHGQHADLLTQREADLLKLFAENPNQVIKRSEILEKLWGEDDYFLGRSLDVFISRLRKYLQAEKSLKIENIHGVGFRLNTSHSQQPL